MTRMTQQQSARIRTAGTQLTTGLATLIDAAREVGPEARLLILDQLWTRNEDGGALQAAADLLAAVAAGMGPAEDASRAYLEDALTHLADTVCGDHIERAQILLAATVAAEQPPTETQSVPSALRDWSTPWAQYSPLDITPAELTPDALAAEVPGWAEAAATPAEVTNWDVRQDIALVPFALDSRGWPLNPAGRTGKCGRNLGKWGENAAADPIVIAGTGDQARVLLITRDDIGVLAIPGGMVDPGETATRALLRELREETTVDLRGQYPVILGTGLVDDWRNSDNAWVSSTVALYQLPATVHAVGQDDALDAGWYPASSMAALEAAVTEAGRVLYAAHRPLLEKAFAHLAQH
ncbi:NUDIX domain-containing protein [Kitasatospora cineracea]|uniref:NUDIX domain-containing protein n=1 Tax=Kitasatospora cineracea TaxID=88074 RepID=UPI0034474361